MPCAAHLGKRDFAFRGAPAEPGWGRGRSLGCCVGPVGRWLFSAPLQDPDIPEGKREGTPRAACGSCRSVGDVAWKDFHQSCLGATGLRIPAASRLPRIGEHPARVIPRRGNASQGRSVLGMAADQRNACPEMSVLPSAPRILQSRSFISSCSKKCPNICVCWEAEDFGWDHLERDQEYLKAAEDLPQPPTLENTAILPPRVEITAAGRDYLRIKSPLKIKSPANGAAGGKGSGRGQAGWPTWSTSDGVPVSIIKREE